MSSAVREQQVGNVVNQRAIAALASTKPLPGGWL